jgi:hypothetical protein
MKRRMGLIVIVILLASAVLPAAASSPTIQGEISGVEICPQSICGAAIFTGTFQGVAGTRPTAGFFWTAIRHDPLPAPQNSSAITGGKWNLSTPGKVFIGPVIGGTLFNNGDNTYTVDATLGLSRGGTGTVLFSGKLDHNDFPPTIEGTLSQP